MVFLFTSGRNWNLSWHWKLNSLSCDDLNLSCTEECEWFLYRDQRWGLLCILLVGCRDAFASLDLFNNHGGWKPCRTLMETAEKAREAEGKLSINVAQDWSCSCGQRMRFFHKLLTCPLERMLTILFKKWHFIQVLSFAYLWFHLHIFYCAAPWKYIHLFHSLL